MYAKTAVFPYFSASRVSILSAFVMQVASDSLQYQYAADVIYSQTCLF